MNINANVLGTRLSLNVLILWINTFFSDALVFFIIIQIVIDNDSTYGIASEDIKVSINNLKKQVRFKILLGLIYVN